LSGESADLKIEIKGDAGRPGRWRIERALLWQVDLRGGLEVHSDVLIRKRREGAWKDWFWRTGR